MTRTSRRTLRRARQSMPYGVDRRIEGSRTVAVVWTPRRSMDQPGRVPRRVAALAVAAALVLTVVVLLGVPGAARAAEARATGMTVSIWPEYDDPRVLVMYQTQLSPDVALPLDLTIAVSPDADVGMACEVLPDGGHACRPYRTVALPAADGRRWTGVRYQVQAQHRLFLEYYQQVPAPDGDRRLFDVAIRPTMAIDDLVVEVQEPLRATGFSLLPAASRTAVDSRGMTYHVLDLGPVGPDQTIVVSISYSKPDREPSVAAGSPGAATGESVSAAGAGSGAVASGSDRSMLGVALTGGLRSGLWLGALLVGFAALFAGGFLALRPSPARLRAGVSSCSACGTPAGPDDRFCTRCGGGLS